ncbi:2-dehydro-3-deoxygalactonokinase [Providencia rettgeri]|uniref:2-dehydro-3-deoxygalactonokinase n=1 Tax=Providencia sp. Me1 TaxID=3392634 RepID=UPI0032DC87AC
MYWIAVDWGTTNFRAFLMKKDEVIDEVIGTEGILSVTENQFDVVLHRNIEHWLTSKGHLPILLAGMVGSQKGWYEVPYQAVPITAKGLTESLKEITTYWGSKAWIVPGIQNLSQYALPDVMRGEETQLLGLVDSADTYAILPGTHSKHSVISHGEIKTFTSFMTGELYSLLIKSSMIGKGLPKQIDNEKYFLMGLEKSKKNIPFTHLIFSARTKQLNKEIPAEYVGSYLSGILIGIELNNVECENKIWVITNESLGEKYIVAGKYFRLNMEYVSGNECFLKGAYKLINQLGN